MIVTIEWMEEWFRRFDQEYFGGKLPVPELGLTHAKTRLGQLAYKRASRWGRTKLYDFKLSMSTYYDMTDKQAKSVLLHEMIPSNPQPIGFRGNLLVKRQKFFYCTYSLGITETS